VVRRVNSVRVSPSHRRHLARRKAQSNPGGAASILDEARGAEGRRDATSIYETGNMIDWLSRSEGAASLEGKPVAVTGVTSGAWGTRLTQTQLRQILTSIQAPVLAQPALFLRDAESIFDEDRNLRDDTARELLPELLVSFDQVDPYGLAVQPRRISAGWRSEIREVVIEAVAMDGLWPIGARITRGCGFRCLIDGPSYGDGEAGRVLGEALRLFGLIRARLRDVLIRLRRQRRPDQASFTCPRREPEAYT
jgi:hypothetical protein